MKELQYAGTYSLRTLDFRLLADADALGALLAKGRKAWVGPTGC